MEGAEHACARPQLAKKFAGKGMFFTYNFGDVDAACEVFNKSGSKYPIAVPIKTEPWFERHCYVIDPNGIPLNLAHWNETPVEPKGKVIPVTFYDPLLRTFVLKFSSRWFFFNILLQSGNEFLV